MIAEIAQVARVTRADVIRVIRGGGTTEADWAIAHAIEAVGGRSAYELMRTAGRDQMIAEIWGDAAGAPAQAPAPTNDLAVYDPQVRVYEEPTAPDAPQAPLPDYPVREEPPTDREAAEELAASVQADLGEVLEDDDAAARLTTAWTTPAEGRQVLARVVPLARLTPRGRIRLWNAEYAAADAA